MRPSHLADLVCPGTTHELVLAPGALEERGEIKDGTLVCGTDSRTVRVINFVPRFHKGSGYSASFGDQWNKFRRTQIDKFNGTTLTKDRFYSGTGWTPQELKGSRLLEVGCGAGRFTQIMLDAEAQVYSTDLSSAVDACLANNGPHPNLCVVQADLYELPFRRQSFDFVFCYGVLQHTPDVRRAFMSLVPFLKPGGKIAVDVYHKGWALEPYMTKYFYRPITKRLPRHLLFRIINWYVPKWLPIDTFIKRIPLLGRVLGMVVPCWNYWYLPLTRDQRIEWGILDTFDGLAPAYDSPQTLETMLEWFQGAGLKHIDVRLGGNGVLGNAQAPS